MTMTDNLKTWLRENCGVAQAADDATYTKVASEAILDGRLTKEHLTELQKDPDAGKAESLADSFKAMAIAMVESQKHVAEQTKAIGELASAMKAQANRRTSGITPDMVTGDGEDGTVVKHITADKRYSTTKGNRYFPTKDSKGRPMPFGGQRMFDGGMMGRRFIDEPSELDRAVCGAFAKVKLFAPLVAKKQMPASVITEHERELFRYAVDKMKWGGYFDPQKEDSYVNADYLSDGQKAAILDDGGATGGLEIVPIVFDDAIITTPLLHSEFYPRVNVVNLPRGRRVEGAKVANPNWAWAATEATAIPEITNTASFVSEFNTDIMTVTGYMTMGRDFLADTPVNFGDIVTQNIGQGLLNELDDVIVGGDGTTQPDGIVGTLTNVVSMGGAWSVGNMELLYFGIGKEYTQGTDTNRICFGANQLSYQRIRAIATGVTGDVRLAFGMEISDYMLFGHPFLISDTYGNAQASFSNLSRYRMYRVLGMQTEMTTDGQTLMLANSALLVFRARFGGQLEDFEASAYTVTGQV